MNQTASMYGPVMGAYFRKYADCVQKDPNAIVDEKKSYFYIDTSEYMSYSNADLSDEYHVHHGPQPEGDSLDSSWLSEVDKFLKGEENQLKITRSSTTITSSSSTRASQLPIKFPNLCTVNP